jgi:hypothetical protein
LLGRHAEPWFCDDPDQHAAVVVRLRLDLDLGVRGGTTCRSPATRRAAITSAVMVSVSSVLVDRGADPLEALDLAASAERIVSATDSGSPMICCSGGPTAPRGCSRCGAAGWRTWSSR